MSRICLTMGLRRHSRSWRLSSFVYSQAAPHSARTNSGLWTCLTSVTNRQPRCRFLIHEVDTSHQSVGCTDFFQETVGPGYGRTAVIEVKPSNYDHLRTSFCKVEARARWVPGFSLAACWSRTLSNWMSAPTAPGAAACQGSRIATVCKVSGSPSPGCIGTLPKPGENWVQHSAWDTCRSCSVALRHRFTKVFTGAVDRVDLYRDPGGAEWVNEMTRQHALHRLELIVL